MNKYLVLLMLSTIVIGAAQGQSGEFASFSIEGVDYKFGLSKGDCIPVGRDQELAEKISSIDHNNMTHFTIILCEEAGGSTDFTKWGMLKTPRGSIGKRIPTRQIIVRDFMKNFNGKNFGDLFDDATKLAGKSFKDVFGLDAKVSGHMEPIAVDESAGYLGGTLTTLIGSEEMLVAVVASMTVVRKHIFFYYRYAKYQGVSDLVGLLAEVKTDTHRFLVGNEQ